MSTTTTCTIPEGQWRFFRDPGVSGPMDDPRLALLASCVANQQRFAGFGDCIDIREAKCPICRAPGFNTGMGFWKHTCGAEVSSDREDCIGCEIEEPFPQPQKTKCTRCGGRGLLHVDEPECNGGVCMEPCERCGGAGFVMDTDPFSSVDRECTTCKGTGST